VAGDGAGARGGSVCLAPLDPARDPTPGEYVIAARATDATGRSQPGDQPWNRGGFANTSAQQVEVLVLPHD
jgi:hypothetical protein